MGQAAEAAPVVLLRGAQLPAVDIDAGRVEAARLVQDAGLIVVGLVEFAGFTVVARLADAALHVGQAVSALFRCRLQRRRAGLAAGTTP